MIKKQNNKMIKKITLTLGIIITLLFAISFVNAYELRCLGYGESLIDGDKVTYTCWHDFCQACVNDLNYTTLFSRCSGSLSCSSGGSTELDVTPPEITINSPIQDEIYTSRKVLFDLEINEPSTIYWIDNINGRGRWKRICSSCRDYLRGVSIDEGFNDITIRAKDRKGNEVLVKKQFFVDSKDPKISRTYPRKGFADGLFEVQFKEDNPETLILHYGVYGDMREVELNLENDCYEERGRNYCNKDVSLNEFDGETIEYWFVLEDIAENVDESKHTLLEVDTTFPVLNNQNSFWEQGEGRYSKYIYFTFDVTEKNFEEIVYTYEDSRGRTREKRLCSRLRDGICETKKTFRRGHQELTVNIIDEAGNMIGMPIAFDVDY